MLSTRLYNTVFRRSCFVSSFASAQGMVSSIYLLHLLNKVKISEIASATFNLSMHSATLIRQFNTTFFRSSSTSSITPVFVTTPPKYLFDIEIVRFTRFPSVFASSELILSTTSSHEMIPSFSNGISCRTKKRTASTPNRRTISSAYITFPLDLLILPSFWISHGCPKICFGSGTPSAISMIGQ